MGLMDEDEILIFFKLGVVVEPTTSVIKCFIEGPAASDRGRVIEGPLVGMVDDGPIVGPAASAIDRCVAGPDPSVIRVVIAGPLASLDA